MRERQWSSALGLNRPRSHNTRGHLRLIADQLLDLALFLKHQTDLHSSVRLSPFLALVHSSPTNPLPYQTRLLSPLPPQPSSSTSFFLPPNSHDTVRTISNRRRRVFLVEHSNTARTAGDGSRAVPQQQQQHAFFFLYSNVVYCQREERPIDIAVASSHVAPDECRSHVHGIAAASNTDELYDP